jgi:putative membrane protein
MPPAGSTGSSPFAVKEVMMKSHARGSAIRLRNDRILIAAFAAVSLSVLGAVPAVAQQPTPYYPPMWGGGWWMFFGPVTMILVVAAAVAVVVLLVRWLGGPVVGGIDRQPPTKSALDILKERYARGEIDKQEYEERRRVLGG